MPEDKPKSEELEKLVISIEEDADSELICDVIRFFGDHSGMWNSDTLRKRFGWTIIGKMMNEYRIIRPSITKSGISKYCLSKLGRSLYEHMRTT